MHSAAPAWDGCLSPAAITMGLTPSPISTTCEGRLAHSSIGGLKNWRDQILNYFIERISNGFVEGTDNTLRAILSTAFGYRHFGNFKLRLFAGFGIFYANPR
jgi:hypothetical protein